MTFTVTTIRKLRALGLDQSTTDAVLEIFEEARQAKPTKNGCAADRQARGTRLAGDWALPPEWREWALAVGLRPNELAREVEKFRNYWTSQAGAKGIKLDWRGTWRNWCILMLERAGRPVVTPPEGGGAALTAEGPETFTDATWRAIAKRYRSSGSWSPEWGSPPSSMGCLMPVEYL